MAKSLPRATRVRLLPRRWLESELLADIERASAAYRERRDAERSAKGKDSSREKSTQERCRRVIALLPRLQNPLTACHTLALLYNDQRYWTVLRYCTEDSISADDLRTEMGSRISKQTILAEGGIGLKLAARILSAIAIADFPWLTEHRAPTAVEFADAVKATARAIIKQHVETARRSLERDFLEGFFVDIVLAYGLTLSPNPKGGIQDPSDVPAYGYFMMNCVVGNDSADLVIGLPWGRMLIIECKGSNTETNSRKRLYKELTGAAHHWTQWFGRQVIVAAGIRGVFTLDTVTLAQEELYLFWQHRPQDLIDFLDACAAQPKGNSLPRMAQAAPGVPIRPLPDNAGRKPIQGQQEDFHF